MKSPVLLPAILILAGILSFVFSPHAYIPRLVIAAGMIWLAVVYIQGQRRKV